MASIGTVIDPKEISAVVSNPNAVAVSGINNGNSASGFIAGPEPIFHSVVGVFGRSNNAGVFGFSDKAGGGTGVAGNTNAGSGTGVHGHTSTGVGVLGTSDSSGPAGRFVGNVEVTGDITAHDLKISGGDCAEEFELSGALSEVSPGTVMVMDETGALRPNCSAYDKKVVGVVSGAGEYQPGIVLDKRESSGIRVPIALVGKVFCKADARNSPIAVGDLLTTSATPGHAMKAGNSAQAFGAVIGKALQPLHAGLGLIPILIALQ
ncbi:MAG TPA: hypothetical protein VH369_01425 [Bryobacteraceae bacterium]|jgi:hypothetical protein